MQRIRALRRVLARQPWRKLEVQRAILALDVTNADSRFGLPLQGPIAMLCLQLAKNGIKLRSDLLLVLPRGLVMHAFHASWQDVDAQWIAAVVRGRNRRASVARTHARAADVQCNVALAHVLRRLGEKERRVLCHVYARAAWAPGHSAAIGRTSGKCPHCANKVLAQGLCLCLRPCPLVR